MSFLDLENQDSRVIAIVATSTFAICIAYYIWGSFSNGSTKQANKVKLNKKDKSAPLTLEGKIENVALRYENEFKPRIEKLIESYNKKNEKEVYERNYCNEMLLKLLIELDGIDLVDVEAERKKLLKQKRKDIIKVIQSELKTLDALN